MCFMPKAPDPVEPAPPPPPPPVLEQAAPNTAVNDQIKGQAQGTKKYRTSGLGITSDGGSGNSSLGIAT